MSTIDRFFAKQSKPRSAEAQIETKKLNPGSDSKQKQAADAATQQNTLRNSSVSKYTDKQAGTCSSCDPGQDSMDIDQVQKQAKAAGAGIPLLDSTNQQASGGSKQGDVIDLSGDLPKAAGCPKFGTPASTAGHSMLQEQQVQQADPKQGQGQWKDPEIAQNQEPELIAIDVDEEAGSDTVAQAAETREQGALPAAPPLEKGASDADENPPAAAEPATPLGPRLAAAAATPGSAPVNTSTAKVPAEAFLTAEQRKQLLEACELEVPLLEAELDGRPDLAADLQSFQQQQVTSSKKGHTLDLKCQVSLLVEGQSMNLTQLAQHISTALGGSNSTAEGEAAAADGDTAAAAAPSGGAAVTALAVRNIIQDVASRKSYSLQDGLLSNVDALEDTSPSYHWCWELRAFTGLPKPIKQAADAARKRRKRALDRLKAAAAFMQLAKSYTKSTKTIEAKLAKAAAKLAKLPAPGDTGSAAANPVAATAAAVVAAAAAAEQQQPAGAAKAKADVEALADKEAKSAAKAAKQAEKEAEAAAKTAEKAAKAAAKQAEAEEKARQKAEAEQKREEARKQKEAEASRKAEEAARKKAEAARKREAAAAAKKGFQSITQMHKAQGALTSFLGKAVRPAPSPAAPSGDTSQGTGSQHDGTQAGAVKDAHKLWAVVAGGPTPEQVAMMQQLDQALPYFSCSNEDAAGSTGSTAGSSGAAPAAVRPMAELLSSLLERWRKLRQLNKRVWGMPPSWAQRPGAAADPSHVEATAVALYGHGVELSRLRCYRRKLIRHHDSVRPAFYGSMSQRSRGVHGRKPFGQDVELDYEVESDQDWEDEPEGESLSDDAGDEEEAADADGEEDEEGFVVGDGYLSEDEGMKDTDDIDAADLVGATSGDSSACEQAAVAQLEAGLERAWQRGRPLVLVNNYPDMSWEPTSNLDPSLLSSLKGTVLDQAALSSLAPRTPAQLWHLYSAAEIAAASAAAGAVGSTAGDAGPSGAAVAGTAEVAVAGATPGGGSGGGRGRPPALLPDVLLPALVTHIQANSMLTMDKLVAAFVDAQAAVGVKVAKARVKDKIKEVTTMRMVAKAPKYTVKPEYLQPGAATAAGAGQGSALTPSTEAVPAAVAVTAAAAAAAAVETAADKMEVDEVLNGCDARPPQQQAQPDAAPSAAGMKRKASDACAADAQAECKREQATAVSSSAEPELESPAAVAAATEQAAGPQAKKQKTPGGGIERFFSKAAVQQPQQQAQQSPQQQLQQQRQGEQQVETPPSTPRGQKPGAPDAAGTAAEGNAGAGVGAVHTSGGILPMLTPPSHDIGAERPTVCNSPVPFRMNAAPGDAGAGAAAERPPVNRWHAQANCRGMGLQGGNAGSVQGEQQQQQDEPQQSSQPFAGFQQQQQQQGEDPQQQHTNAGDEAVRAQAAAAAAAAARAAANPASSARHSAGGSSAASAGGSGSNVQPDREPPMLPSNGSLPSMSFWRRLASWIVGARDPCKADIDRAMEVFKSGNLECCLHTMPQMILTAMVKTLGSPTQGLPMRTACAICIGSVAICFAKQQQAHTHSGGAADADAAHPPAAGDAVAADAPAAAAGASTPQAQRNAAAGETTAGASGSKLARSAAGSPSPSASPRSAPVTVSIEELCAEPGLLSSLQKCMTPSKILEAAKDAANKAAITGSSSRPGEAEELSREAVRAVASLLRFGLPNPLGPDHAWQPTSSAAAAQLRLQLAGVPAWRGALKVAAKSADRQRSTHALMCMWALLTDAASAKKFIANQRLAKIVLNTAGECGKSEHWVIQKWSLLVVSALLSEESFRQWALPQEALGSSVAAGHDDDMSALEGLGTLAAAVLYRNGGEMFESSLTRLLAQRALSLSRVLVEVLCSQNELHNTRLPKRLQAIWAGDQAHPGGLLQAVQAVADQQDWKEAAERASNIIRTASSITGDASAAEAADVGSPEVEMEDI